MLTDAGQRFAACRNRRPQETVRRASAQPMCRSCGLIRRVLDERRRTPRPAARFRNELEDYMSEDYADETLKTIVSLGPLRRAVRL